MRHATLFFFSEGVNVRTMGAEETVDKMMNMARHLVLGSCLAGLLFCGCSADVKVDNSREDHKKPQSVKTDDKRREPTPEELRQAKIDQKRDAIEAEYSPTNAAALYVEKPMAWFQETNDKMVFTRKKLLEAQARISMIYGKYDRQIKAGGDKSKGYLDLLDKAEKARTEGNSKGWPVAFDQWVIDDEEALNAKIAEINTAMDKNRVLNVEDTAMYNAAKTALENSREMLVRFDNDYQEFVRVWDLVKLGQLKGIPIELEKEIKSALDITQVYLNEWNRVK